MSNRGVSVFGLGYVGSVTAACLAQHENTVIGLDINPAKVEALQSGRSPVVEPKVDEMIAQALASARLRATTDINLAIQQTDISFVSVPTPSQPNGKLDLRSVDRVSRELGAAIRGKSSFHTIVVRSTVLPGTCDEIVIPAVEQASGKKHGTGFGVCMNPEFLREGTAVADFNNPSITVLGSASSVSLARLRELYAWVPGRVFETSLRTAEMVKYECNAFHALKVAFANEIGTLCKQLGVDAREVTDIFLSDTKLNISPSYLTPGFAFGGSCLPKDLRAIMYRGKELDLSLPLLESVLPSNIEHIERAVHSVLTTGKRRVAVLGLSFKPGTDDLRESPLVQMVKRLLGEGCSIKIWDDNVALGRLIGSNRQFIEDVIPHIGSLLSDNLDAVLAEAEVVVVSTKAISKADLLGRLRDDQIVVDLVHLEKKAQATAARAGYSGICW